MITIKNGGKGPIQVELFIKVKEKKEFQAITLYSGEKKIIENSDISKMEMDRLSNLSGVKVLEDVKNKLSEVEKEKELLAQAALKKKELQKEAEKGKKGGDK